MLKRHQWSVPLELRAFIIYYFLGRWGGGQVSKSGAIQGNLGVGGGISIILSSALQILFGDICTRSVSSLWL
jgi:hypothetical protein